ncbi:MAG: serine hydrolase, partial [Eubacteriales bacterium]|nr:serine hydrolase [Eubacteriales bacterium]
MKDRKQLPRSTPESCGISSEHILRFIDKLERYRLNMHSYIIIRHGSILSEGYWKPFCADRLHRMYSVSKTFTSAAIGLLCDEGRISLTDKIVSYFPDKLPSEILPYAADMTIRDLLIMATPYSAPT